MEEPNEPCPLYDRQVTWCKTCATPAVPKQVYCGLHRRLTNPTLLETLLSGIYLGWASLLLFYWLFGYGFIVHMMNMFRLTGMQDDHSWAGVMVAFSIFHLVLVVTPERHQWQVRLLRCVLCTVAALFWTYVTIFAFILEGITEFMMVAVMMSAFAWCTMYRTGEIRRGW